MKQCKLENSYYMKIEALIADCSRFCYLGWGDAGYGLPLASM